MYVIPEGWDSISENSSIQNKSGEEIKLTDVMEWKSNKQLTLDPTGNGKDENASTIVIITPTGDTPKTEPEKNPTTGANDFVGVARPGELLLCWPRWRRCLPAFRREWKAEILWWGRAHRCGQALPAMG